MSSSSLLAGRRVAVVIPRAVTLTSAETQSDNRGVVSRRTQVAYRRDDVERVGVQHL